MKRVGDNPPVRFPERAISENAAPWWIAKIMPRQEKAMAFDLIKENIEYYLPMYTKVTRRKDNNKPRKSVLPLFSGYISFCAEIGMQNRVFRTGRVVNVIEVRNQKRFVEQLTQVYASLTTGVSLEPVEAFEPGAEVYVFTGPLRGIRGVVTRMQNQSRLVLTVDGLGRAAMVVDASTVKPVEDKSQTSSTKSQATTRNQ